jgi:hypothetical protein
MSAETLARAIAANWRREDLAGWPLFEKYVAPELGSTAFNRLPLLHGNKKPSPEEIAVASIAAYVSIGSWSGFRGDLMDIADDPRAPWPWRVSEIPDLVAERALKHVIPAATAEPPRMAIKVYRDDKSDPLLPMRLIGAEMLSAVRLKLPDGTERDIETIKLVALTRPDLQTVIDWLIAFAREHPDKDGNPLRLKQTDTALWLECKVATGATWDQFIEAMRALPPEGRFPRGLYR